MYNAIFYSHQERNQDTSPEILKKFLLEVYNFYPSSVIDLGCGRGGFLKSFRDSGSKVYGYDGPWVPQDQLLIPYDCFTSVDITKSFPSPHRVELALCLEMAEHVPASYSQTIVDFLVASSDVVYFSAAIPFQGGAGHVNEQWQDYWANLFLDRGYEADIRIRDYVWNNMDYSPYYAQNGIFYLKKDSKAFRHLKVLRGGTLNVVHPLIFNKKIHRYRFLEKIYRFLINIIYK